MHLFTLLAVPLLSAASSDHVPDRNVKLMSCLQQSSLSMGSATCAKKIGAKALFNKRLQSIARPLKWKRSRNQKVIASPDADTISLSGLSTQDDIENEDGVSMSGTSNYGDVDTDAEVLEDEEISTPQRNWRKRFSSPFAKAKKSLKSSLTRAKKTLKKPFVKMESRNRRRKSSLQSI